MPKNDEKNKKKIYSLFLFFLVLYDSNENTETIDLKKGAIIHFCLYIKSSSI